MKKLMLIGCLVCGIFLSKAQTFPSEIWHEGKLVLNSNDTIKGLIKYDLDNDLIQIGVENVIQTYSSRKIITFQIFDRSIDNYRRFYALPYSVKLNYKVPILFEVLYEGTLSLLARETIVMETVPQYTGTYRSSPYSRQRLAYTYYFLEKGSEIFKYLPKKRELYYIMRKKSSEIEKFMKKNRLRAEDKNDLIKITSYYNTLIEAS